LALSTLQVTRTRRTLGSNACSCLATIFFRTSSPFGEFHSFKSQHRRWMWGCMKSWLIPDITIQCLQKHFSFSVPSSELLGLHDIQSELHNLKKHLGTDCALMEDPSKRAEVETNSRGSPNTDSLGQRDLISRPTSELRWNSV